MMVRQFQKIEKGFICIDEKEIFEETKHKTLEHIERVEKYKKLIEQGETLFEKEEEDGNEPIHLIKLIERMYKIAIKGITNLPQNKFLDEGYDMSEIKFCANFLYQSKILTKTENGVEVNKNLYRKWQRSPNKRKLII